VSRQAVPLTNSAKFRYPTCDKEKLIVSVGKLSMNDKFGAQVLMTESWF